MQSHIRTPGPTKAGKTFPGPQFYFAQHWTKRAFCWMNWLPRLHKGLHIKPEENENLNNSSPTAATVTNTWWGDSDCFRPCFYIKWLGCLLHAGGCHDADIDFHLQAALRTFNANRWILTDRHVSLATKSKSKSKSKLAGPKAAPLGRKQKQFKIC